LEKSEKEYIGERDMHLRRNMKESASLNGTNKGETVSVLFFIFSSIHSYSKHCNKLW